MEVHFLDAVEQALNRLLPLRGIGRFVSLQRERHPLILFQIKGLDQLQMAIRINCFDDFGHAFILALGEKQYNLKPNIRGESDHEAFHSRDSIIRGGGGRFIGRLFHAALRTDASGVAGQVVAVAEAVTRANCSDDGRVSRR